MYTPEMLAHTQQRPSDGLSYDPGPEFMFCQGQDDVEDIPSKRSILGRHLDTVCLDPHLTFGDQAWVLGLSRQAPH